MFVKILILLFDKFNIIKYKTFLFSKLISEDKFLNRYAILLGSAPEDFRQTKIEDMFDFLSSKDGERRGGVVAFPNGISEIMLGAGSGQLIQTESGANSSIIHLERLTRPL